MKAEGVVADLTGVDITPVASAVKEVAQEDVVGSSNSKDTSFLGAGSSGYVTMSFSMPIPEGTRALPSHLTGCDFDFSKSTLHAFTTKENERFRNKALALRKASWRLFQEFGHQIQDGSQFYVVEFKHVMMLERSLEEARVVYYEWKESVLETLQADVDSHLINNPELAELLMERGITLSAAEIMRKCVFTSCVSSSASRPQLLGQETDEEYGERVRADALERTRQVRESISYKLEGIIGKKTSLSKSAQEKVSTLVEELSDANIFDESFGVQAKEAKQFLSRFEIGKVRDDVFNDFVKGIREVLGTSKVSNLN